PGATFNTSTPAASSAVDSAPVFGTVTGHADLRPIQQGNPPPALTCQTAANGVAPNSSVLVCVVDALPNGAMAYEPFGVIIPAGAQGDQTFSTGLLTAGGADDGSRITAALQTLAQQGIGALAHRAQSNVAITGFVADAGAAQHVSAASQDVHGA